MVTNTATAIETGGAGLSDLNASIGVTINYPAIIIPPTPPPSGGGGGGAGGYVYKTGDMELDIQKLVSLDGVNYYGDSENTVLKVTIPENRTTTLFNKVVIKNLGEVSATDIQFRHYFNTGSSDITANEPVSNLVGASFKNDLIEVDKVMVGREYVFTYTIDVHENGQNVNPAIDGLELVDYGSNLTAMQDGLTYLGIGDLDETYLYAGNSASITGVVQQTGGTTTGGTTGGTTGTGTGTTTGTSSVLGINVSTDLSEAAVGDTVNYTVTLQNLTDGDLTNLFINHAYGPNAFDVVSAPGAQNDGRELRFQRPLLRPGETITLHFSLRVKDGAPVGQMIDSLTRVLVNEYEGIAPVSSAIQILSGPATSGTEPDRPYELAQTGPVGIMIMLLLFSTLAYFGAGYTRSTLYLRKRRLALASI